VSHAGTFAELRAHEALGALPPEVKRFSERPKSRALSARLQSVECPSFPARSAARAVAAAAEQVSILYHSAHGDNVMDVDGNIYVDLTAGFGALALGHTPKAIEDAVIDELRRLPLALGDVYASEVKVRLCEALTELFPGADARVLLGSSGSDAVTAALKTAVLKTGKPGIVAFEGAYHGLAHGPLAACGFQASFRSPFQATLSSHVQFAPFPAGEAELGQCLEGVASALRCADVGAILVEPVLGRGGCVDPPNAFLPELRALASAAGALLIVDEIWTGMGRSGAMLASAAVLPDVVCLGKALGGGLPISACIGSSAAMEAWGAHGGSTIHTSTHAGAPLGARAALEVLAALTTQQLPKRAATLGGHMRARLIGHGFRVSGVGLMIGVAVPDSVVGGGFALASRMLARGYIVLCGGPSGRTLTLTPALTANMALMDGFVDALADEVFSQGQKP
jgi:4-aminobutyrate aminotransferase-like enzyme